MCVCVCVCVCLSVCQSVCPSVRPPVCRRRLRGQGCLVGAWHTCLPSAACFKGLRGQTQRFVFLFVNIDPSMRASMSRHPLVSHPSQQNRRTNGRKDESTSTHYRRYRTGLAHGPLNLLSRWR